MDLTENVFDTLKENLLFKAINFKDFSTMLACLEAKQESFKKGEIILFTGGPVYNVGLVLKGRVKISKEDPRGQQNLLAELGTAELFAEVFACAGIIKSPVTVTAAEDCQILFINYRKIITTCSNACCFHNQLVENMLFLLAKKNLMLNQKLEILSKRTTRERLLLFFDNQRGGAKKFSINYNREELAAYLCVDRSALSNELSKLRKEGVLAFNKNSFELLQ